MELSDRVSLCSRPGAFRSKFAFAVPCAVCGPLSWAGRMQAPAMGEGAAGFVGPGLCCHIVSLGLWVGWQ